MTKIQRLLWLESRERYNRADIKSGQTSVAVIRGDVVTLSDMVKDARKRLERLEKFVLPTCDNCGKREDD